MVAGNVVPFDSVLVDVVQDAHASLNAAVDVELCVVRLWNRDPVVELGLVSSFRPGLVGPAWRRGVGGRHFDSGSGPEPTVDVDRLKVVPVTAFEVAEPTGSPDVGQVI